MDFICKVTNNYRFCDFFFQKLRINMKTVWNKWLTITASHLTKLNKYYFMNLYL